MNAITTFFSLAKKLARPIRNNRGMNTSSMYGIVIFLIGAVGSALTFVVNGAIETNQDVKHTTEYTSTVNAVDAGARSIRNTLKAKQFVQLNDAGWDHLGVFVEEIEYGVTYKISKPLGDKHVVSYVYNVGGQVFFSVGTTKGMLDNEALKTAALLSTLYSRRMQDATDRFYNFDEIASDFKTRSHNVSSATFIANGAQAHQNLYVDGKVQIDNNMNIPELNVTSNAMLLINGDLVINKKDFVFNGIVIVTGNVIISNGANIKGALYVGGFVSSSDVEGKGANNISIGSSTKPAYLYAQKSITLSNNSDLYGYIISDTSVTIGNSSYLNGGVYGFTAAPTVGNNDSQSVTPVEITEINDEIGLIMIYNASLGSGIVINTRPTIE